MEIIGRNIFLPITDRELVEQARTEAAATHQAMEELDRYKMQGLGMAAFALEMWSALDEHGLTREERLAMVTAALRGR